ncbi:MAG: cob(I)yrinic acid a,c-diamide adenosyltransferase [Candidatus Magasanikbacteria bacterium]|nr:cob(I)yrinic acid a,c-diamide adenosyltransferase [Candidatus Magasanikbacteria bacterium]
MNKIYTKTGDTGETSLFGAGRVRKDHVRVRAYGEIDEVNSLLGLARATVFNDEKTKELDPVLARIQDRLFVMGSMLSTPQEAALYAKIPRLAVEDVIFLEVAIDRLALQLPHLHSFILPGGSHAAGLLHVARAVCRRAERTMVALARDTTLDPLLTQYINRLSDFLFEAARWVNGVLGVSETSWRG